MKVDPLSVVAYIPEAQREALLLGLAWAEAEEMRPDGWTFGLSTSEEWSEEAGWQAWSVSPAFWNGETEDDTEHCHGVGESPAAALRALTVAFRARQS